MGIYPSALYIGNLASWLEFLGQSKEREFTLSLDPLGLKTYLPVKASTIPYPPEVPGKKACITAED